MEKSEKRILALTVTSHGLTHVAELAFPSTALLVSAEFFGTHEYADIGFAMFLASFLFGAAALPSGRLVDKLGPRRVLLLFLFGTAISLSLLAAAPGFKSFTGFLALLGFFSGLYHPAGTTMISLGIREHGKAMGAHGMGGNLGLAITPFLAAGLAAALGGWRKAYLVLAAFPFLLGGFLLNRSFRERNHARGLGKSESEDGATEAEPGLEGPEDKNNYRALPLFLMFAMVMFNGMTYRGLMTFLPAYFAEKVHSSFIPADQVTLAGALTTGILLLGVLGQMTGGILADRVNKEKLYTAIFFISTPVLLLLGRLQETPLLLATGLFAFLYFMNQPVGNAMIPRYAGPGVRGRAFGLFFFMGFGAGSIMSWIAGYVGDRFKLESIFLLLAATLFLCSWLGLLLVAVEARRRGSGTGN